MPLLVVEEAGSGELAARRAGMGDYAEALRALLLLLEPGEVTTYGELAALMGVSPRLVGRLLASNPDAVVIPCHRVVSERGIGGYSSGGPRVKAALLELESGGGPPRLRRLSAELLGRERAIAPSGRRTRRARRDARGASCPPRSSGT